MIPFLDLSVTYRTTYREIGEAVAAVLARGLYVLGPEVSAFEDEFAAYCGSRHAIGVGNGLDAIYLLLASAGVGPDDDVIVPAHTFIATWLAVTRLGARPVPVEPRIDTYNIDPVLVEAAITPQTKAVIAVHMYGQPADMARLRALCAARGVALFEDAAQAHGAATHGRRAGSLGHGAAFSFYPAKNLGALGDGGAVVVDDDELAGALRLRRNHGSVRRNHHKVEGVNSRLDEVQAAALRVRLRHLDRWNRRRRELAAAYTEMLADLPHLVLPHVPTWADPVWYVYAIRHPRRDDLASHLRALGIGTQTYYPEPPHLTEAYRALGFERGAFPVAEEIANTNLALPLHPDLSDADCQRVAAAVAQFCEIDGAA